MLTVKHITLSGEEFLYSTTRANFVPARAKDCAPANDSLWIYEGPDESERELRSGTIFVMNERGSTVARYDLGASMVPFGSPIGAEVPDPFPLRVA